MAKIKEIFRYPVKGLPAQKLTKTKIANGAGIAFDRFWAIENGTRDFDPENPRFFPKRRFLQLAENPRLATLSCQFDEMQKTLTLSHANKMLICVDLNNLEEFSKFEECVARFMDGDLRGAPRLVSAEGHHFCDIPQNAISLINKASVREIAKAAGKEVSPMRFRGNIYIDDIEPWAELDWEGKTVNIEGKPIFEVFAVTGRCRAIQVNLNTGERDVETLEVLSENFGHTKCGIYMSAIADGEIKAGGMLTID